MTEPLPEVPSNTKFNLDSAKLARYISDAYDALSDFHLVDGNNKEVQQSFRTKLLECMKTEHAAFVYEHAVICDDTNNPPSIVDTGRVNVDIYWNTPIHMYRLLLGPNRRSS